MLNGSYMWTCCKIDFVGHFYVRFYSLQLYYVNYSHFRNFAYCIFLEKLI